MLWLEWVGGDFSRLGRKYPLCFKIVWWRIVTCLRSVVLLGDHTHRLSTLKKIWGVGHLFEPKSCVRKQGIEWIWITQTLWQCRLTADSVDTWKYESKETKYFECIMWMNIMQCCYQTSMVVSVLQQEGDSPIQTLTRSGCFKTTGQFWEPHQNPVKGKPPH